MEVKEGHQKVSSKSNTRLRNNANVRAKRTPKTLKVEENRNTLPAIISEPFNSKNFDLVGKIDDMRALTKELSIMARQLEQWVGVAYTVSTAFKDNGVLKDLVKAILSINSGNPNQQQQETTQSKRRERYQPAPPPFPFPFFGGRENDEVEDEELNRKSKQDNPYENANIFDILNNPAFKEIVSKLFLQPKK